MKQQVFTCGCLVFLLLFSTGIYAKILRVGYGGTPVPGKDFTDVSSANNAAKKGDTLQIYGIISSQGVINKRLVVEGFGYNFDVHPGLQAIGTDEPSYAYLYFDKGSDSSIVEGLTVSAIVRVSKVIFRRCALNLDLYSDQNPVNDIKVYSCIFLGGGMSYNNYYTCSNFQMFNCVFYQPLNFYLTGSSGLIENCSGPGIEYVGNQSFLNLNTAGFLVKNCILPGYSPNNVNTVYENNFFGTDQPSPLPLGTNNYWSQDWSVIFKQLGTSDVEAGYYGTEKFDENYYILKNGSPAIDAGKDANNKNTDCGIYGGELAYRYKLSGVPAIPAIYKLTAPSLNATSNPYTITISVRGNN